MFRVGDEVVCVNAIPGGHYDPPRAHLVRGEVYTISAVRMARGREILVVELVEAPWLANDGGPGSFRADRFRKVQRRKTDMSIESFLTIKPGFEEPRRVTTPTRKRERA
jgi:hypothetical protein